MKPGSLPPAQMTALRLSRSDRRGECRGSHGSRCDRQGPELCLWRDFLAASRSASALRTHSLAAFFIENLALRRNLRVERFTFLKPPFQVLRRADEEVHREGSGKFPADLHGLIVLISRRHDDEQIHVAVLVRLAVGVRAEQDDLVRMEAFRDLTRVATDDRHRDVGRAVATDNLGLRFAGFLAHALILPRSFRAVMPPRGTIE